MTTTALKVIAPQSAQGWATNGGVYFGQQVEMTGRTEWPLEGKETEPNPPGSLKTTWNGAGGEHRYAADRHLLTIGPNGSGKSRKLLLPNLYRLRDWSIVVIDPKGELAAHTAVFRASRPGHRVIVLDPFSVIPANYPALYEKHADVLASHGFNPLGALDPENRRFVDDARALAAALISIDQSRDPYFPQSAQGLVTGLIMGLRLRYGESCSLGEMRAALGQSPRDMAKLNNFLVETYREACPAVEANLGEFRHFSPDDRELGGVRRTAKTQTNWLDSPDIQADLRGGVIDFASMKKTPTTVYLVLPPEYLVSHGTWLRLMVTAILLPLLRSVERSPVPVLFMLDEFAQLGHMEVIMNNYALMRGFGVKLWTVWQDLSQAKRLYKDQWESFISNAGIVQSFAPQDLTTRNYISDLAGEKGRVYDTKGDSASLNMSRGGPSINFGGSGGEHRTKEKVVKPHELAALHQDESIFFHQRRGLLNLSILPQPELLTMPSPSDEKSVSARMAEARASIEA